MDLDQEKEAAARASIRFVQDGNIVGLGTGSTAAYMLPLLGERVKAGLRIQGIPTSDRTAQIARSVGIPLTTLEEAGAIDVTIDGADELDPQLQLIKGGGGALVHEKIVAKASRQLVIIADSSKQVAVLGKFPLPVAVFAPSQEDAAAAITALGAAVQLRKKDGQAFVTDEGHYILDCQFGQIPDPPALARRLESVPGLVDHGLFINLADVALIGKGSEVLELHRKGPKDHRPAV
jgi:ribose 5-phosphate isomerase A